MLTPILHPLPVDHTEPLSKRMELTFDHRYSTSVQTGTSGIEREIVRVEQSGILKRCGESNQ